MAKYPTVQAIWLGDFNTVLNPSLDRLQPLNSTSGIDRDTKFSKLISSFHLVDSWRHNFPHKRAYSCFSSAHNSMSRIDFILISHSLTPRLLETVFSPRLLSDHSPYWITISIPTDKPIRNWRLNPFWLSLFPEDDDLANEWKTYFSTNDKSAPVESIWESFKLHARMQLTSRINRIKSDSTGALDKAVTELSLTEQTYVNDPSPINASTLKLQTRVVTQLQYEKARQKLFFAKQKQV